MSAPPNKVFLKDYAPPAHLIPEIKLDFTLGESATIVRSSLRVESNPNARANQTLVLDGEDLELIAIAIDGRPLSTDAYVIADGQLLIPAFPHSATLEITTKIYPHLNLSFSGLYQTKTIFCTQMEAQGFRRVTYFPDRPDVLSKYSTTITADKARYPYLLSNGNLVEQKDLAGGQHMAHWDDPFPKPCYLFALVAGDLDFVEDTYMTLSQRKVDLRIYVDKGKAARAKHAMNCLKQSMKWDEDTYGLEYDLGIYNIVAVDDFNMGAMENKGLNIFNSKYVLADTTSATDDEFTGILRVIGHEYFHNWSGNRVTCRDWFQLSLKEGLTVYRDQEFTCDLTSRAVKRIEDVDLLRSRQFPEDAGPMAHPVRPPSYISIDNFYTSTVYIKGAEVIRMLQTLLGGEMFKKGLATYFALFDGQAVTTDDFVYAMEQVSGKDLTTFKNWYSQAGTPLVSVTCDYDAPTQCLTINFTQQTADPLRQQENQPFHIPIKLGLISRTGSSLEFVVSPGGEKTKETLFELTEVQGTLKLYNVIQPPVLSLFRDFSAPVKLNFAQADDDLYLLMTKDTDAFNRWESGQKILLKNLLNFYHGIKHDQPPQFPPALMAALRLVIQEGHHEPALTAQLLRLPSPHYLIQFIDDVDPQAIVGAYRFFHTTVAGVLGEILASTYQLLSDTSLGHSQMDIGKRAFKNTILRLLAEDDENLASQWAHRQFSTAKNMTDRLAALGKSSQTNTAQATADLLAFYEDWKSDTLVINKWLTIHATSRVLGTLDGIKKVMADPVYDKANPNNIYALLYHFANDNWQNFHRPDGAAYGWLAQQILDIDSRNPQVASRMASSFNNWQKFANPYKAEMKKALETIAKAVTSKNVFEIVNRALNS